MKIQRIEQQPAFTLHTRAYEDNSLLVTLLTLEYGKISLIAYNTRSKKSSLRALLQPFYPLLISYNLKTSLGTLRKAEANGINYYLKAKSLLSALYLNELLIKLLPEQESCCELFNFYQKTLEKLLSISNPAKDLRIFEKYLLKDLGYEINLLTTISQESIKPNLHYCYKFGHGFSETFSTNHKTFAGQSLIALAKETLTTREELDDAKQLLRGVISFILGNRPLKSREFFHLPVNNS